MRVAVARVPHVGAAVAEIAGADKSLQNERRLRVSSTSGLRPLPFFVIIITYLRVYSNTDYCFIAVYYYVCVVSHVCIENRIYSGALELLCAQRVRLGPLVMRGIGDVA